jgi:hypothetical protein
MKFKCLCDIYNITSSNEDTSMDLYGVFIVLLMTAAWQIFSSEVAYLNLQVYAISYVGHSHSLISDVHPHN